MENKLINFHIFRYHLLPLSKKNKQFEMFENSDLSFEEIKERKNEFFRNILDELTSIENKHHPLKLEHNEDDKYIFKMANKKTTRITQNFKNQIIANEPFCYIVFDNDPTVQKIAISDNPEAFSSPIVVKNNLRRIFRKGLEKYGLNIEIEQLFDKKGFWEYVKEHKKEITYINFQFIKPNLANISRSLPEAFKDFANDTNSHDSHIIIKAPEKGTLDNINKDNKDISGLVDYTSNGAGSIKLKVKGVRTQLNTKENPKIIKMAEIEEAEIEGSPEEVIKFYKTLMQFEID
ncbi:hypothetical protein [Formosa sp. S-31]|uniref:hypothetical protein n=1 Tax=Formosa sp. S-31 TaxID=2790949 RepID=UPI003EBC9D22